MKSVKYQTGTNYELWIGSDDEPNDKIQIGIRLKSGHFSTHCNFTAVLLNTTQLKLLIQDLQQRLEDKKNEIR